MKTVFIIITRGFIIRNVLRSGGLDLMKKKGYRIVLFLACPSVPEYLRKELESPEVTLFSIKDFGHSKIHRLFSSVASFLLCTESTRRYIKYGNPRLINRPRIFTNIQIGYVWVISKIPFLKPLSRSIETRFFPDHIPPIKKYFDEFLPDLVFSTSITSRIDVTFMKEAKRRRIPAVSMPKGWDNVTRNFFPFVPDYFIVQNELLRDKLSTLQKFPKERISMVGFPQFDWYVKKDILLSREEFCKEYNLDPKRAIILFGSEGAWADKDHLVAGKIADWINSGKLIKPSQMLIRPHFSNVKKQLFSYLEKTPHVSVDNSYNISDAFVDNWDPLNPETIALTNTLYHADMLITTASTLNLDIASFDHPIINLGFGGKYRGKEDITPWLYKSSHMRWVMETGGVNLVMNEEELLREINTYLANPAKDHEGRERLLKELCFKVDGHSSERMVEALDTILSENRKVY